MYKYSFLLSLVFLCHLSGFGQQVEERLIIKDAGDSLFLNAFRTTFDTAGNYYFETLLKAREGKFAMITNKRKYTPVFTGSSIATTPLKGLIADAFFSDTSRKKIYYKNKLGTKIYGPRAGKIRELLEFGRDNIVMELCTGATSYLYINDSLVNVTDSLKQRWLCFFSDNGNVIYSYYKNGIYKLFLNYKQIDSSSDAFSEIAVNNNKFYVYTKAEQGVYSVHTPTKQFGPFGAVDFSDLWNNNAYYVRGCADSSCYVLVNDKLYNKIPESHSLLEDPVAGGLAYQSDEQIAVEPYNLNNYIFSYNQNNENGIFLNVNGKINHFNYTNTSFIFSDNKGGYAFYGTRNDSFGQEQTFKNVNGAERRLPIFKKGKARPQCMQIAPNGESVYFFETADSIYLYRNDTLMCKPALKKKFLTWDASVFPQIHADGLTYFQGINIDGVSYLVYDNSISKPLPMIYPSYNRLDEVKKGCIVAGDFNSHGFFIIENTAPGKYLLVINNKVYKELDGIDNIFGEQSYFDDHSVIFYGTKGNAFYQFKVNY